MRIISRLSRHRPNPKWSCSGLLNNRLPRSRRLRSPVLPPPHPSRWRSHPCLPLHRKFPSGLPNRNQSRPPPPSPLVPRPRPRLSLASVPLPRSLPLPRQLVRPPFQPQGRHRRLTGRFHPMRIPRFPWCRARPTRRPLPVSYPPTRQHPAQSPLICSPSLRAMHRCPNNRPTPPSKGAFLRPQPNPRQSARVQRLSQPPCQQQAVPKWRPPRMLEPCRPRTSNASRRWEC